MPLAPLVAPFRFEATAAPRLSLRSKSSLSEDGIDRPTAQLPPTPTLRRSDSKTKCGGIGSEGRRLTVVTFSSASAPGTPRFAPGRSEEGKLIGYLAGRIPLPSRRSLELNSRETISANVQKRAREVVIAQPYDSLRINPRLPFLSIRSNPHCEKPR